MRICAAAAKGHVTSPESALRLPASNPVITFHSAFYLVMGKLLAQVLLAEMFTFELCVCCVCVCVREQSIRAMMKVNHH